MCTVEHVPGKNVNNSTYFRGRIPFHPANRIRAGRSKRIRDGQGGFRGFNFSLCEPNITERGGPGGKTNWIELLQTNLFQNLDLPDPLAENQEDGGDNEGADEVQPFQHTPNNCADAIITAVAALYQSDTGNNLGGNSHFLEQITRFLL